MSPSAASVPTASPSAAPAPTAPSLPSPPPSAAVTPTCSMRSARHPPPALSLRLRATQPTYPPAQRILLQHRAVIRTHQTGGARWWVQRLGHGFTIATTLGSHQQIGNPPTNNGRYLLRVSSWAPCIDRGPLAGGKPWLGSTSWHACAARTARTCSDVTHRSKVTQGYVRHARDAA
jgi:hypothetical protein